MLIPLSHENLKGRRWPIITIGIIALNCVVFLGTHWRIDGEAKRIGEVKVRTLLLAATHPDVKLTPAQQQLVDSFKQGHEDVFKKLSSSQRRPTDVWDIEMREWDAAQADTEMAALGQQLELLQAESILERFAFQPHRHLPASYLTANFLHGGWLHLIFNMWFLWLAGSILEDVWGRIVYPIFYLVAGVIALLVHAGMFPTSIIPVVGASGAIAGLMGAFLVRFPKTRIELGYLWLSFRPRFFRFRVPAYAVLPLWLVGQVFWGLLGGETSGVAYWAHIGGFAFGAFGAVLLKVTGIEHAMDRAIEAKVSWSADPRIVHATELMEKNQLDEAIAELRKLCEESPDDIQAHEVLQNVYWRKQDFEAHRQTLATVCQLHLKARDLEAAWRDYEEFKNAGGDGLPSATWLELCRHVENQQNWERAASEYESLAHAWPNDRTAVLALIAAARINLKNLNRREDAARLYREADASPVPHLDWDSIIQRGLKQAAGEPVADSQPALAGSPPAKRSL